MSTRLVKYCTNVFIIESTEALKKEQEITVKTKRMTEIDCIIHNLVTQKDGLYYYSFTRADGFNSQERAARKAAKYAAWENSAISKSNEKWNQSNEGKEFLALGEPIKIGHHSERRHRALIERNHARMDKAMELQEKADSHARKAEYWRAQEGKIDLSMPESVEFFEAKLEQAKALHAGYKDGSIPREHGYSLTYANKAVKDLEKKLKIAKILWSN